jgi:activating signal cointegrator 1
MTTHMIYTVGYNGGWTVELLAREIASRNAYLLDIRHKPTSTKAEWRRVALTQRFGRRYHHVPGLGNVNYQGGEIHLADPEGAMPVVRELLDRGPVVLLCACPNWQTCHRRQAAAFLAERLGATVEHLSAPAATADGTLPALTLTQPWATLVALREKRIETRSWSTGYRGRIAIHAGKGPATYGWQYLQHLCRNVEPFRSVLAPLIQDGHVAERLPLGAIVATAELVDCVPTDVLVARGEVPRHTQEGVPVIWLLTEQERAFGNYEAGRFAWLLDDVRPLATPIQARGAQGLWRYTPPAGVEL